MEAVEFMRTLQKLCTGSKCYDCPLEEKGRCIIIHAVNPEESVRIVEEWAAEQKQQTKERRREVTLAELTTIKSDRDKLAARFAAVDEKINALIASAEAISYGFESECEALRETVRENYALAREMIEEYNAALDGIERRRE